MRVFIALPQYRPMQPEKEIEIASALGFKNWRPFGLHPMCTKSLAGLRKTPYEFELNMVRNDAMVERARSALFGQWLKEWKNGNRFDYFMCLDEDIEFHPESVVRMLESGKPVIGGEYAYKTKTGIKVGRSVCRYLEGETPDENGFLRVRWLGGGFLLVKAEVLLDMVLGFPELYYQDFENSAESYGLWLAMIYAHPDGKRILLSEDYAFCERIRNRGHDIWLDTEARLTHWHETQAYRIGDEPGEKDRDGISGWMSSRELSWLADVAKDMDSIVEIGSWKGRSTKVLLENCSGPVYAVDHFNGSSDITGIIAKKENIHAQFLQNVGHYPNLRILRMSSEEAAKDFEGQVDMVFIDGDHSFWSVRKDIEMWLPKCRKLICGHDYREVMYAVYSVLGNVRVAEDIWYRYL